MKQVVSFDLDGVLANFTRGFTRIGRDLFGTPVGSEQCQQTWMFEEFPELGLDKTKCEAIWKVVKSSPTFWADLDPMDVTVMQRVNAIKNKIFITNRLGEEPLAQSKEFLRRWGVYAPTLIVAEKKAPVAIEYGVVAHVDDYIRNCDEIREHGPKNCLLALHYTPYNRIHHDRWIQLNDENAIVTLSVDHFIDICEDRNLVQY